MRQLLFVLVSAFMALAADQSPRPRILGLAHVAFRVGNIETAREFYEKFLGLAEPFSLTNPDGSLALTFVKINDRQYLELFPGLDPRWPTGCIMWLSKPTMPNACARILRPAA